MAGEVIELFIHHDICEELAIKPGKKASLSLGSITKTVIIRVTKNSIGHMTVAVPSKLAQALNLPVGITMNIAGKGKELRLGPLLGVLTKEHLEAVKSFGPQDTYYRKLLSAVRDVNGFGYVFTPQVIDYRKKRIQGWILTSGMNSTWKRSWLPFPDVCYNRYFRKDRGVYSQEVLEKLAKTGVKSFNYPLGTKWSVQIMLEQHGDIKHHLPETRIMDNSSDIEEMSKRHKVLYIKPVLGYQGQGVTRVIRDSKRYLCRSTSETVDTILKTPAEVLKKARGTRKAPMLIQQGIECPEYVGHFDFRVLVQKDNWGRWEVTGMAVRVGAPDQITSNLHTGGHAARTEYLLAELGFTPVEVSMVINDLTNLSILIAGYLEKTVVDVAEVGLDFIIDNNRKVWFLEANSKPGRRVFGEIDAQNLRKLSIIRPAQYACHLAGFTWRDRSDI
ncbi:MAG: YheC/YheD family protein [Candidatus Saccharibacteria bacterium]